MSDPLPLLDLTYRADLGILVGRWDHQPDPGGLPADEQLATGTRAANSRFWLQDIRRRTLNDPAITAWLLAVYLSDMARCLGPRLCVVCLTSPDLH